MRDYEAAPKNTNGLKVIYILVFLLAAMVLYYFVDYEGDFTDIFTAVQPDAGEILIVSEISSSKSGYTSGLYREDFDWIELYNPSERGIQLSAYYLSDKVDAPYKYQLPEMTLPGGAYVVIFASGHDLYEENEIHTNFKISSKGETVLLSNKETIVSTIKMPPTDNNFSYGYGEEGTLGYLTPTTPMKKNGPAYASEADYYSFNCTPNGIYINEYMSKDQQAIYDESGRYPDWVELINTTDTDVSLKDYSLTDNIYEPRRFLLPDIILEKHQTLLIFLDGEDTAGGEYIHANFSLSQNDGSLNLFNADLCLVDTVAVVETEAYVSYGRNGKDIDLWQYFNIPTPNQPNIFEGAAQKKTISENYPNYVLLNEVKPIAANESNGTDWIELYNNSNKTISLSGFGLSDSRKDLFKWVFPKDADMAPGSYMVVYASGKNTVDAQKNYHTNFKLNAGLEDIYLSSSLGYVVDKMPARHIEKDNAIGKLPDGEAYLLKTQTPGKANPDQTFFGYTKSVTYDYQAGIYPEAISLTLSCDEPSSQIYYTLDGTKPTKNAVRYTDPIKVNKNTTVSAIAVSPNKLDSAISCQSYILGSPHDLPVVVITCEAKYLNGSEGIMTRANRDRQVPATIEIIEPEGKGYICFNAEIGLFGNTSLYAPQKSFAVEVESDFGGNRIVYDLFPGDSKTPDIFGSFVLRNGGSNEWNRTKLTDAFLMSLARLGMNVDAQAYRPCAVYLNGAYYGLLNIREKMNRDYIENKYGFERDDIDIVEPTTNGEYGAVQGDAVEFMDMVHYIRKHDLARQENYAYIKNKLDIDNYIDSILAHIISGNKDTGNIKFWKAGEANGAKWRVFLFDMDRAAYYPAVNHLAQRTAIDGHGSGNLFDTSIIRGMLENDEFRALFIKRAIELIDTLYSPEFSTAYYDYLVARTVSEMEKNLDMWWEYAYNDASGSSTFGSKPENKDTARRFILHEQDRHRNFLENRQHYMLKFFKSYFDLSDADIEKFRREIANENRAPTQIYAAFIQNGRIEDAIKLANQLNTAGLSVVE